MNNVIYVNYFAPENQEQEFLLLLSKMLQLEILDKLSAERDALKLTFKDEYTRNIVRTYLVENGYINLKKGEAVCSQ